MDRWQFFRERERERCFASFCVDGIAYYWLVSNKSKSKAACVCRVESWNLRGDSQTV